MFRVFSSPAAERATHAVTVLVLLLAIGLNYQAIVGSSPNWLLLGGLAVLALLTNLWRARRESFSGEVLLRRRLAGALAVIAAAVSLLDLALARRLAVPLIVALLVVALISLALGVLAFAVAPSHRKTTNT